MRDKLLKPISLKKPTKKQREQHVLLGLVDLYLRFGKPVGSNTLKENGFSHLSSATIRNYFVQLEKEEFLHQQHVSGGRVPTDKAFRSYAAYYVDQGTVEEAEDFALKKILCRQTDKIHTYLHEAIEVLSSLLNCTVLISSPRFDQDFIQDIQLFPLDENRILCALMTHFGLIKTETLYVNSQIKNFSALRKYFLWRMSKINEKPYFSYESDAKWAQRLYNEVVARHIAGYAHFFKEDILQTGLSNLLSYPEFSEATNLYNGLAILEDELLKRKLLNECIKENRLKYWIGEQLHEQSTAQNSYCSMIAIPYYINKTAVGSIALLGPVRIAYRKFFGILRLFSHYLSETLTKNMYKFKIHYRQPSESSMPFEKIQKDPSIFLEDQRD